MRAWPRGANARGRRSSYAATATLKHRVTFLGNNQCPHTIAALRTKLPNGGSRPAQQATGWPTHPLPEHGRFVEGEVEGVVHIHGPHHGGHGGLPGPAPNENCDLQPTAETTDLGVIQEQMRKRSNMLTIAQILQAAAVLLKLR